MKWRYSVQFENDRGAWQEDDSFIEATEALKHRDDIASPEKKRVRVVDLEDGVEIV